MLKLFYHDHNSYKIGPINFDDKQIGHPYYLLDYKRNVELITNTNLLERYFKNIDINTNKIWKIILEINNEKI